MTASGYKSAREQRGTQEEVAALLGVSRVTVAKRETSAMAITPEAVLAISALPKKRAPRNPKAGRAAGAGVRAKRSDSKRKKYNASDQLPRP